MTLYIVKKDYYLVEVQLCTYILLHLYECCCWFVCLSLRMSCALRLRLINHNSMTTRCSKIIQRFWDMHCGVEILHLNMFGLCSSVRTCVLNEVGVEYEHQTWKRNAVYNWDQQKHICTSCMVLLMKHAAYFPCCYNICHCYLPTCSPCIPTTSGYCTKAKLTLQSIHQRTPRWQYIAVGPELH